MGARVAELKGLISRVRLVLAAQASQDAQMAAASISHLDINLGRIIGNIISGSDPNSRLAQTNALIAFLTSQLNELAGIQASLRRIYDNLS